MLRIGFRNFAKIIRLLGRQAGKALSRVNRRAAASPPITFRSLFIPSSPSRSRFRTLEIFNKPTFFSPAGGDLSSMIPNR
jgi:hypothetical protein